MRFGDLCRTSIYLCFASTQAFHCTYGHFCGFTMVSDAASSNGVDPDRLLDSFLNARASHKTIRKPLQASDHINRPFSSQKIHITALRVVDSYFSSREKTTITQKKTVSKALACLRASSSRQDQQLYLLKNSQRFIIDLIDICDIYFAFNELRELQKSFCDTLGVNSNEDGSIPFVEIPSDLEPTLLNLAVSYHFLYMQCLLLGCSKYLKSIFLETCSFITTARVFSVPSFFLKDSPFGKWLASLHAVKPQSEQKNLHNMGKLIAGFSKLLEKAPITCGISNHGKLLQHTKNCLQLKIIELRVKSNSPTESTIPSLDSSLEPFILDLKEVLIIHKRADLLTRIDDAMQFPAPSEKSCAPNLETLSLINGENIESTNLSGPPISLERLTRLIKEGDHSLTELYVLDILPHITKEDLPVMDRITVYLKDCIADSSCKIQFFEACISRMFSVFKQLRQWKRIRNISNLLVNLGNRNDAHSLNYWKESISLEVLILQEQTDNNRYDDQETLRLKSERIIEILVKRSQYQYTMHFFGQLFNNLHFEGLDDSLKVFAMPKVMSYLGAVLSRDLSTCYELFLGLNEQRAALVIVNLLRYSGTNWDASTLSSIMHHSEVKSAFFKLLCEYEILKCVPEFSLVSDGFVAGNLEGLLLCGIAVQHDPFGAVSQFEHYLSSSSPPFEIWLEQDILWNLVVNLQLSSLHEQTVYLITLYLSERAFKEDSQDTNNLKWMLSLNLKLCSSQIACNKLALLHQTLSTCASLLKNIAAVDSLQVKSCDVLTWKLLQLEFEHKTDLASATKRHATVISFVKSKKEFTLNDTRSSFPNKLENLFAVAKALFVSGDLELSLKRHGAAYDDLRIAVKLLLSISKKLDSLRSTSYSSFATEVSDLLSRALIRGIKVQYMLGLSKDSEAFVDELQSVASTIHSRGRRILVLKEMVIFRALQCDLKRFKQAFQFFLEQFDDLNYKSLFNDFYQGCLHLAMSTKQVDETSEVKPTLEFAFLSNLLTNAKSSWESNSEDRECLSLLLKSRLGLSSAIRSLQMIPLYSNFPNSVSSLPSFNELELVFKSQLSGIRGHEKARIELIDQLVFVSDKLFKQSSVMESLAPYEIHHLHSSLSGALLALNSISQVSDSTKTKMTKVLQQLFYLQNVLRARSLIGERLSHLLKVQKGDSLLPSSISFEQPSQETLLHKTDSFFDRITRYLPSDWTIVTIDRCPDSDSLLLTRLTHLGSPFVVRLPLLRMKHRGKSTVSADQVSSKLQAIVEASNMSTQAATTSQIKTKEDRKQWWSSRFGLDLQFENLLDVVHRTWIGGFSGLFGASIDAKTIELFRVDFVKAWQEILPKRLARVSDTFTFLDDEILRLFLTVSDIHSPLSDYDILDGIKESLSDLIYFTLDSLSLAGETIPYNEINMEKSVQIVASVVSKFTSMHSWNHGHTIIVPAKEFEMFPWESLLALKGISVSRVHSVEILLELLEKRNVTSARVKKNLKLAYLLNPGGDLSRTEANFSSFFQCRSSWDGITGRSPGTGFFENNVIGKDLYVYLGHGGCEQYINTNDLMRASASGLDIPSSLLIGCSSASLTQMGLLESYGNIYSWLAAGSPMVLVNLWDVTDKDIDKFSMSVFEHWGLSSGEHNLNLCQAVSRSREKCTLRHLNGSSPVVYGLPLRVDQL